MSGTAAYDSCEAAKALGNKAYQSGRIEEAIRCFSAAIDLAQKETASDSDKANLHIFYRSVLLRCRRTDGNFIMHIRSHGLETLFLCWDWKQPLMLLGTTETR